jgi:ubiquinone biosynthesis protein UbiJ
VLGDVVGVQVANAIAAGLRHARDAGASFAANAAEYVTEESRDVVGRDELNAFHDDVDTIRDDVARIAARVARIQNALEHAALERPATNGRDLVEGPAK